MESAETQRIAKEEENQRQSRRPKPKWRRPRGHEKRARASRRVCMLWVCGRRGIVRSREEERVKRRRSLELGATRGADYAVCEKSVTKYRRCAIFTKSFIAVGMCGLCGCRVTGGVHRAVAEWRGQHDGKRGDAAYGEGGGKPKTKQETQTKWRRPRGHEKRARASRRVCML